MDAAGLSFAFSFPLPLGILHCGFNLLDEPPVSDPEDSLFQMFEILCPLPLMTSLRLPFLSDDLDS
jgi:hypothetical protein